MPSPITLTKTRHTALPRPKEECWHPPDSGNGCPASLQTECFEGSTAEPPTLLGVQGLRCRVLLWIYMNSGSAETAKHTYKENVPQKMNGPHQHTLQAKFQLSPGKSPPSIQS